MSQAHVIEESKGTHQQVDTTPTSVTHGHAEGEKHAYQHKKMGDILDEMDVMMSRRREQMTAKASEKVTGLLDELKSLYEGLKTMASESPQNVDPLAIKHKQNQLSHLENKAVQGIYGAEAKICPLDQPGQPMHHVRIQAIPPGQATIRDLIETCHQMITRVMDRLEETVTSLGASEHGTSTATSTTTVKTGPGTGTGTIGHGQTAHVQTHGTGVTLTEGGKPQQEGTGTKAPITSQGAGASVNVSQ